MGELNKLAQDHLYNLVRDNAKLSEQQCNALNDLKSTMKSATSVYETLHKQILLHVQTNEQFTQKIFESLSNINNNIEKYKKYVRLLLAIIAVLAVSVAILLGFPETKLIIGKIFKLL